MKKIIDEKDYVSFRTAKHLKECGMPQDDDDDLVITYNANGELGQYLTKDESLVYAPMLYEAIKWLLKQKGLFVYAVPQPNDGKLQWIGCGYDTTSFSNFHSYECFFWEEFNNIKEALDNGIDVALQKYFENKEE